MSGKRGLGKRFFGFVMHRYNDNFEISQLKETIRVERKNLQGRRDAVAKYNKLIALYKRLNNETITKQAVKMLMIEEDAIPQIQYHIDYLEDQLEEEYRKELGT